MADPAFLPPLDAAAEGSTNSLLRRLLRERIHQESRLPQTDDDGFRRKLVPMLLQRDAGELDLRGEESEDGPGSDRDVEGRREAGGSHGEE